ncbi:hypothetical protein TNCV_3296551 [Trichonephila clavipes]|uniref:Uncharacterized protein n=1 Tax=Trichonephila clavipes TaxID=2585209 RepID=A0A8X6T7B3_TRICX|nr:hypothetical protein TNCV_3296551 [Trichonephila clavipes]
MSGNTCLSKGYPQSEVILKLKDSNSVAQQYMRARNYCTHHNTRDHWMLRCMNRCPDLVVCLKRDLQCLRPEASLVLINRPNVAGMKGRVDLAQPVRKPQTCGVEALYTITRSYSVKNKI